VSHAATAMLVWRGKGRSRTHWSQPRKIGTWGWPRQSGPAARTPLQHTYNRTRNTHMRTHHTHAVSQSCGHTVCPAGGWGERTDGGELVLGGPLGGQVACAIDGVRGGPMAERLLPVKEHQLQTHCPPPTNTPHEVLRDMTHDTRHTTSWRGRGANGWWRWGRRGGRRASARCRAAERRALPSPSPPQSCAAPDVLGAQLVGWLVRPMRRGATSSREGGKRGRNRRRSTGKYLES
jgi:hypothetical protein